MPAFFCSLGERCRSGVSSAGDDALGQEVGEAPGRLRVLLVPWRAYFSDVSAGTKQWERAGENFVDAVTLAKRSQVEELVQRQRREDVLAIARRLFRGESRSSHEIEKEHVQWF